MSSFDEYATKYKTARMERRNGVLQVTLHTDGQSLRWGFLPHGELPEAFHDIGTDRDNRVVILTGTGPEFSGPRATPGTSSFPARPSIEGRAGKEEVPGVARGPENSGPVPVRMTTRLSRSVPMSWNASGSSPCGRNPQRSDWPSVCRVTWSTPFLRSIRAVLYLVAYSSNELILASH